MRIPLFKKGNDEKKKNSQIAGMEGRSE